MPRIFSVIFSVLLSEKVSMRRFHVDVRQSLDLRVMAVDEVSRGGFFWSKKNFRERSVNERHATLKLSPIVWKSSVGVFSRSTAISIENISPVDPLMTVPIFATFDVFQRCVESSRDRRLTFRFIFVSTKTGIFIAQRQSFILRRWNWTAAVDGSIFVVHHVSFMFPVVVSVLWAFELTFSLFRWSLLRLNSNN